MADVYFYKNAKQENTKLQDDFVYKNERIEDSIF